MRCCCRFALRAVLVWGVGQGVDCARCAPLLGRRPPLSLPAPAPCPAPAGSLRPPASRLPWVHSRCRLRPSRAARPWTPQQRRWHHSHPAQSPTTGGQCTSQGRGRMQPVPGAGLAAGRASSAQQWAPSRAAVASRDRDRVRGRRSRQVLMHACPQVVVSSSLPDRCCKQWRGAAVGAIACLLATNSRVRSFAAFLSCQCRQAACCWHAQQSFQPQGTHHTAPCQLGRCACLLARVGCVITPSNAGVTPGTALHASPRFPRVSARLAQQPSLKRHAPLVGCGPVLDVCQRLAQPGGQGGGVARIPAQLQLLARGAHNALHGLHHAGGACTGGEARGRAGRGGSR